MKYNEFRNSLKNKTINKYYLFTGEEGILIDKTINFIVSKYIDETFKELNFTHLHGSNISLNEFYSSVETLPFMSDKRVIIVDELNLFMQKVEFDDEFKKLLESLGEDIILIFDDSDLNVKKNTKFYKFFNKNNRVVEFLKLDNKEIFSFLKREILNSGKEISDSNLSYMIMMSGYNNKKLDVNLYELMSDVQKLLSFSKDKTINREDIDKTITKAIDSNIFNLLDNLQIKNSSKSLEVLHDLYDKNEPLQTIFHMIQRRYRHLYTYSSLYKDNKNENEIKKVIGISDYEFKTISNFGRKIPLCDIKESLDYIFEIDKKIKSTGQDEILLLEYLIVNLTK